MSDDATDAAIYVVYGRWPGKSGLLAYFEKVAKEKGYASGGVIPPTSGGYLSGVWIDEFPPATLFTPRSVVRITNTPPKPRFSPRGWMKNQLEIMQAAREKVRSAKAKQIEKLAIENHYRKLEAGQF